MALSDLLDNYSLEVQNKAQFTLDFLLNRYPFLKEEVDLPSRLFVLRIAPGMSGIVFSIILSKKGVKLGFFRGNELNDPHNLLTGTGKVHKYIEIDDLAQLNSPGVIDLLENAVDRARTRQRN